MPRRAGLRGRGRAGRAARPVHRSRRAGRGSQRRDPLEALDEGNLADYCTALEGVSHFHYLVWSLARGRNVSLLELELQAEVDKYASAVALLTRQRAGRFPGGAACAAVRRRELSAAAGRDQPAPLRGSEPARGAILPLAGRADFCARAASGRSVAGGAAAVLPLRTSGEDAAAGGVRLADVWQLQPDSSFFVAVRLGACASLRSTSTARAGRASCAVPCLASRPLSYGL